MHRLAVHSKLDSSRVLAPCADMARLEPGSRVRGLEFCRFRFGGRAVVLLSGSIAAALGGPDGYEIVAECREARRLCIS